MIHKLPPPMVVTEGPKIFDVQCTWEKTLKFLEKMMQHWLSLR